MSGEEFFVVDCTVVEVHDRQVEDNGALYFEHKYITKDYHGNILKVSEWERSDCYIPNYRECFPIKKPSIFSRFFDWIFS